MKKKILILFIIVAIVAIVLVIGELFEEGGKPEAGQKEEQKELTTTTRSSWLLFPLKKVSQAPWVLYSRSLLPTLKSNPNLLDGILNDPSVIKVEKLYTMYYGGVKGDFSDTNTVRIFRVTSKDGITWNRNSVPVLTPGPSSSWDSVKVETPSVLVGPDGTYLMYYSGSNIPDSEAGFQIGLATSRDGVTWEKHSSNPVIKLGSGGAFDKFSLLGPTVVYKGGEYWMWYGGISEKLEVATGLAKSKDGIRWERKGVVMSLDVERENANDVGISENFVLWNGNKFEMFYTILLDAGKIVAPIWHATSKDGVNWVKEKKPVMDRATAGQWTNEALGAPSVLLDGNKYRMWFTGTHTDSKSFFENGIGLMEKERKP